LKIWQTEIDSKPYIIRQLIRITRFILMTIMKFFRDNCLIRSSGLAYSTLLAMVPLTALVYAFGGFGDIESHLESWLITTLVPTQHEIILNALREFTENSQSLGTVGILFFLFTTLFLFNNVENHFNQIWGAAPRKNIFFQFSMYTSVLVIGSLVGGVAVSRGLSLLDFFRDFQIEQLKLSRQIVDALYDYATITGIITFMVMLLPATRVRFKDALKGALCGSLIWQISSHLFELWAATSIKNSIIYGSLSLIPILLLWLYLAWMIILISLEITSVSQNSLSVNRKNQEDNTPGQELYMGFEVMLQITDSFNKGHKAPGNLQLMNKLNLSQADIRIITEKLIKADLICIIGNDRIKKAYIPSRNPQLIMASEVASAIVGDYPVIPESRKKTSAANLTEVFISDAFQNLKLTPMG